MRYWNLVRLFLYLRYRYRLYLAYEVLKQQKLFEYKYPDKKLFVFGLWGIETYPQLSLLYPHKSSLYLAYEVLKLLNVSYCYERDSVFVFGLWGIETEALHRLRNNPDLFVFGLWGIETEIVQIWLSFSKNCLYLAYEVLKHYSTALIGLNDDMFVFGLWGIETDISNF